MTPLSTPGCTQVVKLVAPVLGAAAERSCLVLDIPIGQSPLVQPADGKRDSRAVSRRVLVQCQYGPQLLALCFALAARCTTPPAASHASASSLKQGIAPSLAIDTRRGVKQSSFIERRLEAYDDLPLAFGRSPSRPLATHGDFKTGLSKPEEAAASFAAQRLVGEAGRAEYVETSERMHRVWMSLGPADFEVLSCTFPLLPVLSACARFLNIRSLDFADIDANQDMSCGEIVDYASWCYQQKAAGTRNDAVDVNPDKDEVEDSDDKRGSAFERLGDEALSQCLSKNLLILLADRSLDRVNCFLYSDCTGDT